jgi:hypothetical protein
MQMKLSLTIGKTYGQTAPTLYTIPKAGKSRFGAAKHAPTVRPSRWLYKHRILALKGVLIEPLSKQKDGFRGRPRAPV